MSVIKNLVRANVRENSNGYEITLEADDGQITRLNVTEERMSQFMQSFEEIWFGDGDIIEQPKTFSSS